MAFASWYSLYKNLPKSQVFINLKQRNVGNLFGWCYRCNVKIIKNYDSIKKQIKIIPPTVMAVRNYKNNLEICSSKTDIFNTFVDYKFGCGNFVLDRWINSGEAPFENALKRFSTLDLTINELAVLEIWEQCFVSYRALGGLI